MANTCRLCPAPATSRNEFCADCKAYIDFLAHGGGAVVVTDEEMREMLRAAFYTPPSQGVN